MVAAQDTPPPLPREALKYGKPEIPGPRGPYVWIDCSPFATQLPTDVSTPVPVSPDHKLPHVAWPAGRIDLPITSFVLHTILPLMRPHCMAVGEIHGGVRPVESPSSPFNKDSACPACMSQRASDASRPVPHFVLLQSCSDPQHLGPVRKPISCRGQGRAPGITSADERGSKHDSGQRDADLWGHPPLIVTRPFRSPWSRGGRQPQTVMDSDPDEKSGS